MTEQELDPRYPGTGNYLDWLMDLDPLELSVRNKEEIIAYHRRNRALVESGQKVKKSDGPKVDLEKIGLKAAQKPVKRRGAPAAEATPEAPDEAIPIVPAAPQIVKRRKA